MRTLDADHFKERIMSLKIPCEEKELFTRLINTEPSTDDMTKTLVHYLTAKSSGEDILMRDCGLTDFVEKYEREHPDRKVIWTRTCRQ